MRCCDVATFATVMSAMILTNKDLTLKALNFSSEESRFLSLVPLSPPQL